LRQGSPDSIQGIFVFSIGLAIAEQGSLNISCWKFLKDIKREDFRPIFQILPLLMETRGHVTKISKWGNLLFFVLMRFEPSRLPYCHAMKTQSWSSMGGLLNV